MALPRPKKGIGRPKKADEVYSTSNSSEVEALIAKGFHVADQKPIGGKMVYTFAEPKSVIMGKKEASK